MMLCGIACASFPHMPKVTLLGALVQYDPGNARETILKAGTENQGNVTHTATALHVTHRTLCRWIAALGLGRDFEIMRTKAGVFSPRPEPEKRPRKKRRAMTQRS